MLVFRHVIVLHTKVSEDRRFEEFSVEPIKHCSGGVLDFRRTPVEAGWISYLNTRTQKELINLLKSAAA